MLGGQLGGSLKDQNSFSKTRQPKVCSVQTAEQLKAVIQCLFPTVQVVPSTNLMY